MILNPSDLQTSAEDASALLKSLANPHRLMLVCQLVAAEQSVGALAGLLGVREALASQHLGLLRREGVVRARREGQTVYYSLSSGPARAVIETLWRQFCPIGHGADLQSQSETT